MVVNPKKYQRFAAYSVMSVLGLLFKTSVKIGESISKGKLEECVSDQLISVDRIKLSKTLYQLKRSGYLISDGDSVRLTNKAKMKIVDQVAASYSLSKRFHLVSFDIPEIKRLQRDQFRHAIKRMGFIQIQKSLWVSVREIGDLVEAAAMEYNVSDYVAYFVSDSSNIDKYIKRKFDEQAS